MGGSRTTIDVHFTTKTPHEEGSPLHLVEYEGCIVRYEHLEKVRTVTAERYN